MRHAPLLTFALFVPVVAASLLLSDEHDEDPPCSPPPPVVESQIAPNLALPSIAPAADENVGPRAVDVIDNRAADKNDRLKGLWSKYDGRKDGTPLRFYYFHDGGIGLYRYGRVGLNNTHSYHFSADDTALTFRFNKTGETQKTPYRIIRENDRDVLILDDDPREVTPTRYYKEMGPMAAASSNPGLTDDDDDDDDGSDGIASPGKFDRMWMHVDKFAKGGIDFSIYQFKEPALDGRGVGWHHRGDFDNWSTETLFYRKDGNQITLLFPQRREKATTEFALVTQGKRRTFSLVSDPRNFWQRSAFQDGGQSFAADVHPWLETLRATTVVPETPPLLF